MIQLDAARNRSVGLEKALPSSACAGRRREQQSAERSPRETAVYGFMDSFTAAEGRRYPRKNGSQQGQRKCQAWKCLCGGISRWAEKGLQRAGARGELPRLQFASLMRDQPRSSCCEACRNGKELPNRTEPPGTRGLCDIQVSGPFCCSILPAAGSLEESAQYHSN